MTKNLNFAPACFERCPGIHSAVCAEIGRQALSPELTPSIDLDKVAGAVRDRFQDSLGFVYAEDCEGPAIREEGGEMMIGGPSFNTVKVTYCGRKLKSTGAV